MADVIWLGPAIARLDAIVAYTSQFDAKAAQDRRERLLAATDRLRDFPLSGRPGTRGRRELPTVRPYIIIYQIVRDTVFILSGVHGRQRRRR